LFLCSIRLLSDCHLPRDFQLLRYWRQGGHLKDTKTEGSAKPLPMQPALKNALLEWRTLSCYQQNADFVFPSLRAKGRKPLDLAAVLKCKIKPAFA
jgi:hypothetical protein